MPERAEGWYRVKNSAGGRMVAYWFRDEWAIARCRVVFADEHFDEIDERRIDPTPPPEAAEDAVETVARTIFDAMIWTATGRVWPRWDDGASLRQKDEARLAVRAALAAMGEPT